MEVKEKIDMANRYFVTFAYDGTNYHGWQIQPNGDSVQEELQKALSTILRETIEACRKLRSPPLEAGAMLPRS